MSRFYGWLTGNRGTTTRCGTRNSGILTRLRSLTGIEVSTKLGEKFDGTDVICFCITYGEEVLFRATWDRKRGLVISIPEKVARKPIRVTSEWNIGDIVTIRDHSFVVEGESSNIVARLRKIDKGERYGKRTNGTVVCDTTQ